MVATNNMMSEEEFEQLLNDNPPGSTPPDNEDTSSTQNADNASNDAGSADNTSDTQTQTEAQSAPNENTAGHNANRAFAEMRTQNRKLQQALSAVLQQHGLDPQLVSNPEKLIQDAENARIAEEAKKQNVPTELLQRLTTLEKTNMENQQRRLAEQAMAGFQAVKNQFNLSSKELSEFAKQLQEAGTNPFEQEMDLVQHYRYHNLDKIIEAEKQKAVEEALKNQSVAAAHSTTPSKRQGKDRTGTDDIDTMAKFERFLQNLK